MQPGVNPTISNIKKWYKTEIWTWKNMGIGFREPLPESRCEVWQVWFLCRISRWIAVHVQKYSTKDQDNTSLVEGLVGLLGDF